LRRAIEYREREIAKIRKLHAWIEKGECPAEAAVGREVDALSDRLDLLALLYDQCGETEKAIDLLRESQSVCRQARIKFDGADMLMELLADRATKNGRVMA
jgi:hypothetical protein